MSEYNSSSKLQEVQQRQIQLQYRQDWLQALLGETLRELKLILKVEELIEEHEPGLTISDGDILKFVNQMSSILLGFEQQANTPQEIQHKKKKLQYYRSFFQYLLNDTTRELSVLSQIIKNLTEKT